MTDEALSKGQAADPTTAAIPWYQSKILRGIVTGVLLQVFVKLFTKYHIDSSALFGLTVNELAQYIFDTATGLAVAYTAAARVKQTDAPQVTLSKTQATIINQAVAENLSSTQTIKAQNIQSPQASP